MRKFVAAVGALFLFTAQSSPDGCSEATVVLAKHNHPNSIRLDLTFPSSTASFVVFRRENQQQWFRVSNFLAKQHQTGATFVDGGGTVRYVDNNRQTNWLRPSTTYDYRICPYYYTDRGQRAPQPCIESGYVFVDQNGTTSIG